MVQKFTINVEKTTNTILLCTSEGRMTIKMKLDQQRQTSPTKVEIHLNLCLKSGYKNS